jgi:hypothetical protein
MRAAESSFGKDPAHCSREEIRFSDQHSTPHPVFGHPLPLGEGLALQVRALSQRERVAEGRVRASPLMSRCQEQRNIVTAVDEHARRRVGSLADQAEDEADEQHLNQRIEIILKRVD